MEKFKITENYTLDVEDYAGFQKSMFLESLNIWGFGQDPHSEPGTPEYYVIRLSKANWITHNGNVYKSLSFLDNSNEIYLQQSYSEAKYNAKEYDGWGNGYLIK